MSEQNKARQHTIAKEVSYSGIGLHSGKDVLMTFKPAAAGAGIIFVRTDLPGRPEIKALAENVSSTVKATTLSANGAEVFTVEHLMSALAMMAIDNIYIEMSSPEPPVTDGSAKVFCELLEKAGLQEQEAERRVYAVDKAFTVYDGDRYIAVLPYDGYRISFTSINKHPMLGTQYFDILLDKESYQKEIMPARTVAFTHELEMLRKMGLGLGGSLENVVVFDEDKILSVPRFEDELIRHKILDVIGDLYLLGPIKAHVIAVKTGHAFNSQIAKQIQAYRTKEE
ncbi:MAG: UDP-3-O-acyl-N-acetylglucosamine deacetylase [Phascolarctobacterium sp.]|uniref:UDP-3-O-acyl-N-acetylglucosamine deacetylase n=1 Tax=Phascolarctobacterium sp. TaxID=2049039 RepID=UPI0026DCE4AD|nr:UDP-3-O-acyl-N-acetylglucosamine deacetylase [Phascolarctobacterium sp.]MDO4921734.1 UDP-3-O-acyl-N-acetylglucosamine deacetylase [Phascolarctobacterium sp.]